MATVLTPNVTTITTSGTSDGTGIRLGKSEANNRLSFHRNHAPPRPGDREPDEDLDDVPDGYWATHWDSDDFGTRVNGFYRAHVLVGSMTQPFELGYADIEIIPNGASGAIYRKIDRSEYVPLEYGHTLPINFQIQPAALKCLGVTCVASDACHSAGVCDRTSGACTKPPAPDGTRCDDQNGCTVGEACHAGVCGGGVGCGAEGMCVGAGASAQCQCDPGFQGDGRTCTPALRFLSFPPRAAIAGQTVRYQAVLSIAGGTTFSLVGPAGAQVDDSGLVTWPGALAGETTFTLSATQGTVSVSQTFSLSVAAPSPASQGTYDPNDPRGATVAVSAPLSPIKGAAVVVPQGALGAPAPLTVSSLSGLAPPPGLPIGTDPASLMPIEFGPSGTAFAAPVHLVLPASGATLSHGVSVLTLDASGHWNPVPVERVDLASGVVVARATHFSPYVVVPAMPVYGLQVDLAGQHTACFGNPLVRAPLAQGFAQIPASAVNGWPLPGGPTSAVSLVDVLGQLPAGKALQFATRLDTRYTGTPIEAQSFLLAAATKRSDGTLAIAVVDNRQPGQFLNIPGHGFAAADPELEAWMNGTRTDNVIDSIYADLSAGLGTGIDVTAEAAFAVVDADLATTLLPRPGVVYGYSQTTKTTAQLMPVDGVDRNCNDAQDAWDPNPNSLPPPFITGAPDPFIHALIGQPITVSLSGPAGSTYSFSASDPTLHLHANPDGFSATFTPSARGVFQVNGTVVSAGVSRLWTWSVLVDPPVTFDPPPTAAVTASATSASVGNQVVLTATGTAARVTPDQLKFHWTATPDPTVLQSNSGSTVNFIAGAAGDVVVSVTASDGVTTSPPASVTVSVSPAGAARPPPPPLVTPVAAHVQHAAGAAVPVSISASGAAADGSAATLQFAGAAGAPTSFTLTNVAGGAIFSTSVNGSYRLLVTATDARGNVSPPVEVALLVTAILPPQPVDADGDGYPAGTGPGFDCDDNDATTHPGQPAECDGVKDRNCDGVITDANTCDADHDGYSVAQGDCNDNDAAVHPGAPELCDGVDNNCDGRVDEGYAGLGQPCSAGLGVCAAAGTLACSADHRAVVCNAVPGAPQPETCTGFDDRCDGIVNEGCGASSCPAHPNTVVSIVNGGCRYACAAGFWDLDHDLSNGCEYACAITNGGVELCDGLDNNCDGRVDENLTRNFYDGPAGTAGVGICHPALQSCSAGVWVTLQPEQTPLPETCNLVDDNCNGVIDDGFDLNTNHQHCGSCGTVCSATQHCIAAGCAADQPPSILPLAALTIYEGTTQTVSVTGADPENDPLTFTLPGAPAWATVAASGNQAATMTLAPDASSGQLANPISIEIDANDGYGGIARAFLQVSVTHPPILTVVEAEGPYDASFNLLDSSSFALRAGSMRRVRVQSATAQATSSTPLTVACDAGVSVGAPRQIAPNNELAPPSWATVAAVQYAPAAGDAGAVKHCHASSSDGVTNATHDFTFTVGKGLIAEAPILPGAMPALQSSPAVIDAADGHRYLLVAEQVGLSVYDVTGDLLMPGRVSFTRTPGLNHALAVVSHFAFVGGGIFFPQLWVYDVADPTHPALLGEVSDPAGYPPISDLAVDRAGNRLAAASQNATMLFDLGGFLATGDPAMLSYRYVFVPDSPTGNQVGRAAFATLAGRDILLVPEESGMSLYMVDLASGNVIGSWVEQHNNAGSGARSVTVFTSAQAGLAGKSLALLNTGDGGWIEILDVTDPTHPGLLAPGSAVQTAGYGDVFDGKHFIAEQFSSLTVVDVTDPTLPVQLTRSYVNGYLGGVAFSADGARVYASTWEEDVAIWSTTALVTPPYAGGASVQGPRAETRMVFAADGLIGLAAQRDLVRKLDLSTFPAVETGFASFAPYDFQGVRSLAVRGTLGVSVDQVFSNTIHRAIGLRIHTWDLRGPAPVELGVVEVDDTARAGIANAHVHMVPGLPCVAVGGYGLGVILVDVSNPSAPVATAPFHPQFNGKILQNAQVSDVGSDGRFLVAAAPLPNGDGSLFFWDLGSPATCTTPAFLGNVPDTNTLFNSNGGSVVDPVGHVFYGVTGGGSTRTVNFAPLAAAAAASQPLNVATQTSIQQINLRLPYGNGGGEPLLSASALVLPTDIGPRIYPRNPDGTLGAPENIEDNSPNFGLTSFQRATFGPHLYWDASDSANPNAFVEQGITWARKWASCPAANNADCAASTHPDPCAAPSVCVSAGGGGAGFLRPANTVAINFIADDSANGVFAVDPARTDGGGQLQWKGSMIYDPTTRKITPDATWSGPWAPLYDDGPWDQINATTGAPGHEPQGATAGDHRWGITVFATPPATGTGDVYQYGLVDHSANDGWLWTGNSNGSFTVAPGELDTMTAVGQTLRAFGATDLQVTIDTSQFPPGTSFDTSRVTIKGSVWEWNEVPVSMIAGATQYTFTLSSAVGPGNQLPHAGLLRTGDAPQFVWVFNGAEYNVNGAHSVAGVTAAYRRQGDSSWSPLTVQQQQGGAANPYVTIP